MSTVATIALGEIIAPNDGSVDPANYPDEVFDLYSIPAFDTGQPDVAPGGSIGSTKQVVRSGDVLLSKIVPHIRRSWVVGKPQGRRTIASGEWMVFRSDRIHPRYLRHVLVGDPFHIQFMRTVSGVGGSLLRARPAHVANIAIPLPPLAEQRRIADVLDCAEALRTKRRAALHRLDALAQAIFLDLFGAPTVSRTKWPIAMLGEVCQKITDGTHHSPPVQPSGVPYVTAKHLKEHRLDFYSDPWFVSAADHQVIFGRCDPRRGDVLYIKDGATTGIAAVNHYDFEFSMLSSLALLRPRQAKLLSSYLCYWLNNQMVKRELLGGMAGVAIRRLTLAKINAVHLPVPPIHLQESFAERVAGVERLKAVHSTSLTELDALFASLQRRAFRGEL